MAATVKVDPGYPDHFIYSPEFFPNIVGSLCCGILSAWNPPKRLCGIKLGFHIGFFGSLTTWASLTVGAEQYIDQYRHSDAMRFIPFLLQKDARASPSTEGNSHSSNFGPHFPPSRRRLSEQSQALLPATRVVPTPSTSSVSHPNLRSTTLLASLPACASRGDPAIGRGEGFFLWLKVVILNVVASWVGYKVGVALGILLFGSNVHYIELPPTPNLVSAMTMKKESTSDEQTRYHAKRAIRNHVANPDLEKRESHLSYHLLCLWALMTITLSSLASVHYFLSNEWRLICITSMVAPVGALFRWQATTRLEHLRCFPQALANIPLGTLVSNLIGVCGASLGTRLRCTSLPCVSVAVILKSGITSSLSAIVYEISRHGYKFGRHQDADSHITTTVHKLVYLILTFSLSYLIIKVCTVADGTPPCSRTRFNA